MTGGMFTALESEIVQSLSPSAGWKFCFPAFLFCPESASIAFLPPPRDAASGILFPRTKLSACSRLTSSKMPRFRYVANQGHAHTAVWCSLCAENNDPGEHSTRTKPWYALCLQAPQEIIAEACWGVYVSFVVAMGGPGKPEFFNRSSPCYLSGVRQVWETPSHAHQAALNMIQTIWPSGCSPAKLACRSYSKHDLVFVRKQVQDFVHVFSFPMETSPPNHGKRLVDSHIPKRIPPKLLLLVFFLLCRSLIKQPIWQRAWITPIKSKLPQCIVIIQLQDILGRDDGWNMAPRRGLTLSRLNVYLEKRMSYKEIGDDQ